MSLLQLREAAESASASANSSPSEAASALPSSALSTHTADGVGESSPSPAILPPLPLTASAEPSVPLCLSTAVCFRVQSHLSRPPPSREERALSSSLVFSASMLRVSVELRQQSQSQFLLSSASSLHIFPPPPSDTTHVGSFTMLVHLDTNKARSSKHTELGRSLRSRFTETHNTHKHVCPFFVVRPPCLCMRPPAVLLLRRAQEQSQVRGGPHLAWLCG